MYKYSSYLKKKEVYGKETGIPTTNTVKQEEQKVIRRKTEKKVRKKTTFFLT